jgi:hypothetical protein
MNNENEIVVTKNYIPSSIQKVQLEKLDTVSSDFHEICKQNDMSPVTALKRAYAMQELRGLLTEEIMRPVMELQGNSLGYRSDKEFKKEGGVRVKGDGYDVNVVRDVFIYAIGIGARITGNEINIISGNCYPTKLFFSRRLDEILKPENYRFIHDVPRIASGGNGAVVKSTIRWRDSSSAGEWKEQVLEFAIKGTAEMSCDGFCGKADRKCGKWLLSNITGMQYCEGEVEDDLINITAKEVKEKQKSKLNLEPKKELTAFEKYFKTALVTAENMRKFIKHCNSESVTEETVMCEEAEKDCINWLESLENN